MCKTITDYTDEDFSLRNRLHTALLRLAELEGDLSKAEQRISKLEAFAKVQTQDAKDILEQPAAISSAPKSKRKPRKRVRNVGK